MYMSTYIVHFAHVLGQLFVGALLAKMPRVRTQLGSCGHCRRGLGAIRAVCRAWQALKGVSPAEMFKTNTRNFYTRGLILRTTH